MRQWISYIYERFPPLIYGSLPLGISLSGAHIKGSGLFFFPSLLSFIGLWLFLFVRKINDDIGSFPKDKIAFPSRPFPSGKINIQEAKSTLFLLTLLLFAYSEILWISLEGTAALAFLCLVGWGWCSQLKIIDRLAARTPFIAVVVEPLYAFPMAFFAVSTAFPLLAFTRPAWAYGICLYGALLNYKLCCQLNPRLHPITAEFIHYYGFRKTFYIAAVSLCLSGIGAGMLQVGMLLWPVEFIVLCALLMQFTQRENYRLVECLSAVSLIVHAWAALFHA